MAWVVGFAGCTRNPGAWAVRPDRLRCPPSTPQPVPPGGYEVPCTQPPPDLGSPRRMQEPTLDEDSEYVVPYVISDAASAPNTIDAEGHHVNSTQRTPMLDPIWEEHTQVGETSPSPSELPYAVSTPKGTAGRPNINAPKTPQDFQSRIFRRTSMKYNMHSVHPTHRCCA